MTQSELIQRTTVLGLMAASLVSVGMLLNALASAPVREPAATSTPSATVISDAEAGYNQASYDECMDATETLSIEICHAD